MEKARQPLADTGSMEQRFLMGEFAFILRRNAG